jgi:hypothetical protein
MPKNVINIMKAKTVKSVLKNAKMGNIYIQGIFAVVNHVQKKLHFSLKKQLITLKLKDVFFHVATSIIFLRQKNV